MKAWMWIRCWGRLIPAGVVALAGLAVADDDVRIVVSAEVPDTSALRSRPDRLATEPSPEVRLGGFSDLWSEPDVDDESIRHLWTVTDRGPNGVVKRPEGKFRTLLEPHFVPSLVRLRLEMGSRETTPPCVRVTEVIPLTGRGGRLVSGRPNGVGADEPIYDAAGGTPITVDPDGVDTEGFVRLPDGSSWLAEEYRPSLLEMEGGRLVTRLVPVGDRLDGADLDVHAVLPTRYARRRDNRGFEALAASPDGGRIFALLQSPLEPSGIRRETGGNVRMLVIDPAGRRPVAEHVYVLDDATRDGKLCAMVAIDAGRLLVLEQGDGGRVRLYEADLRDATNTLDGIRDGDAAGVETADDLARLGVRAIAKRRIAALDPLLPRMAADVHGEACAANAGLKLEGMALVGDRRIAIINDNDFGVGAGAGSVPKSCVWVIHVGALER